MFENTTSFHLWQVFLKRHHHSFDVYVFQFACKIMRRESGRKRHQFLNKYTILDFPELRRTEKPVNQWSRDVRTHVGAVRQQEMSVLRSFPDPLCGLLYVQMSVPAHLTVPLKSSVSIRSSSPPCFSNTFLGRH